MQCEKCGAQLDEGTRFCKDCGHPVTQPRQNGQKALIEVEASQTAVRSSGKSIAIGLGIAAVAATVGIGLFAILGDGSDEPADIAPEAPTWSQQASNQAAHESTSTVQTPAQSTSQETASSSVSEQASSESASASEPTATQMPESDSAVLIDLSNPDDYYATNIFLSNFTEWDAFWWGWAYPSRFDRNAPDIEQLVNWGMWHVAINNEGTLQTGERQVDGAPPASWYAAIQPPDMAPNTYSRWMDTELICNAINRYIGLDLDLAGYNSGNGNYFESNGVMYEGIYRGAANPLDNVAMARSVSETGTNLAHINFDVYCGNRQVGTAIEDKSWYGLTPDQLTAAMQAAGSTNIVVKHGSADVEVLGSGADRTFKLVSFEVEN